MRTYALIALALLFVVISAGGVDAGGELDKIAVIDLRRLFELHPKTAVLQRAFDKENTDLMSELARLQKKDGKTADKFKMQAEKALSESRTRRRNEILEAINGVVVPYIRKHGYTLVLDKSGRSMNGMPVILHSDGVEDITNQISALFKGGTGKRTTTTLY